MKLLISTDIEGVSGLTIFNEAKKGNLKYFKYRKIMAKELSSICGILKGNDITIRDAHGDGINLKKRYFDKKVKLIQGFDKSLDGMVKGIDYTFDGVILHGYHSGAGSNMSPVDHTFNNKTIEYIKLNGKIVGETTFSIYTCALYNIPVFYIEGDEGAVLEAKGINNSIIGTITKRFNGEKEIKALDIVLKEIEHDLLIALNKLKKNKDIFKAYLPNNFEIEIKFKNKNHRIWDKKEVTKIDEYTIRYSTNNFIDILKLLH